MEKIGHIKQIWRYPVKSMRGEQLTSASVTYAGIAGDRVWAFVDATNKSDFPWLTARQKAELLLYRPRFIEPRKASGPIPHVEDYAIEVMTPEGDTFAVNDPLFEAMLKQRFGRSIFLRFSERSMHDNRPLSLMGMATVKQLKAELGKPLDYLRFRQNLYIDWEDGRGFWENELLGQALRIGEATDILINKLDERCKIVSINPATAEIDTTIQKHISLVHHNHAGVYAVVLREGMIKAGDSISLL